jgi:Leucine-rich repeat (LRR) protein
MDLEPQWRMAFSEAVFFRKRNAKRYQPTDQELQMLFETENLYVCGSGSFDNRNNSPKISFQLTNLTGLTNLTNLTRIECDYNGRISSLEPISQLHKLRTLWCDNNCITDLSPLIGLESLQKLCCWNNQISSLKPILEDMSPLEGWENGFYGIWSKR